MKQKSRIVIKYSEILIILYVSIKTEKEKWQYCEEKTQNR